MADGRETGKNQLDPGAIEKAKALIRQQLTAQGLTPEEVNLATAEAEADM